MATTEGVAARPRVRFEGEQGMVELGEASATALRREQLRILVDALAEIRATEEGMPAMDDATVRSHLEDLGRALDTAGSAADALWFLAPEYDDGQVEDE